MNASHVLSSRQFALVVGLLLVALTAPWDGKVTADSRTGLGQEIPPRHDETGEFVDQLVAGEFIGPTDVAIARDGRIFVAEKRGLVWIIRDGIRLAEPFLDLRDEVNDTDSRGIMGIALHPHFQRNGYVYLTYVVDPIPGTPEEPKDSATFSRLVRYTAAGDQARLPSRTVLIGHTAADGIPICSPSHASGAIKFAPDGSLYLSTGDGANFTFVDGGQNVGPLDHQCEETFGPAVDIGALRSQSLNNLAGKILRVDPHTGGGLPDNPFFNPDDPIRSRIWALGLRNPFRFTVRSSHTQYGELYIGDVGLSSWEQLNRSQSGGENFLWPCYEGNDPQRGYQTDPHTRKHCQEPVIGQATLPVLTWHHDDPGESGFTGHTASGVAFYTADRFPSRYWEALFFADYGENWIKVAWLNETGEVEEVADFTDAIRPVDLEVDPLTGDLVYVSISTGEVRAIRYVRPTDCLGYAATVIGTEGNDLLLGTSGRDVISGLGGNDMLLGRGGADVICGGSGNDLINGGGGPDEVDGGPGNDLCRRGSDRDTVINCEGAFPLAFSLETAPPDLRACGSIQNREDRLDGNRSYTREEGSRFWREAGMIRHCPRHNGSEAKVEERRTIDYSLYRKALAWPKKLDDENGWPKEIMSQQSRNMEVLKNLVGIDW